MPSKKAKFMAMMNMEKSTLDKKKDIGSKEMKVEKKEKKMKKC